MPLEDEHDDDELEADDESEDYDADKAVGALGTVITFLRPYFSQYRSSLSLLAIGILIETGYNVAFPLSLKYLIDEALYEEDYDALKWIPE